MIIVFFNWIYIFFTTFLIGFGGIKLFAHIYKINFDNNKIHPTLISLFGLALITSAGNYFSIFFRINWEFSTILILSSSVISYILKENIKIYLKNLKLPKIHYLSLLVGSIFVLIAIIKTSGSSEVLDEGEYYLPLIRWIENYPIIAGTGLFNDRMAYNSSFHLSSAIFSHIVFFKGGLYDLNGYLFVIINLYFLKGINRIIGFKSNISISNFLMLFASVVLYRQLLTSIDSDYSYIFISITLLLVFLKNEKKEWDIYAIIFMILCLYLLTIKFLAIFLLPLVLIIFYWKKKQEYFRITLITLGLSILYILPWFIRNVYLSGYLVYPIFIFDIFSVDWKIPLNLAKNNYFYISEHAKISIDRHSLYYDGVRQISIKEWLPLWWKNHTSININALITAISLPPAVLTSILIFIKKGKVLWKSDQNAVILFTLSFIFLIFWFFQYPDVRFGWHWILFILVFTFYQLNILLFKTPLFLIRYCCIALLFLALGRATYKTIKETDEAFFSQNLLFPQTVMTLDKFTSKTIDSIEVTVSEDMFCWGINPPCMPKYYDELNIVMRGNSILDGFKLKEE